MKRTAKVIAWILLTPVLLVVWLWTLGAGYYMAGGGASALGTVVIGGYVVLTLLVLVRFRPYAVAWVIGTCVFALVWLLSLKPSNDRDWRVEVAREPTVAWEDDDRVTIGNIRNFEYRSQEDFDVSYYEKTFDLSKLDTADLVMCYWDGNTEIAHTMLSFGFEGKDYLCLSVEVRREKGEDWGGIPGIFRQFEVLYILADERDLINLRTSYRKEDVYLYRLQVPKNEIRQYFEVMLREVDKLSREPEFYDTLDYNCSSALTRMGKELWPDRPRPTGIRALLNGRTDEIAYGNGRIFTGLPFDELKKKSYITEIGQQYKDAPDFSQKVRAGLPGMN